MATFLMPRATFAPTFCAPSRPTYACHPRASSPRVSVNPFLALVDETLSQLHREAKRQTARKPQPTFDARFDVREHSEGYQVDGEVPGFSQENIDIEISDEYTLKISGSTEKKMESRTQPEPEQEKREVEQAPVTEKAEKDEDQHSESSSVKSYQPTVEDDFEDLGAESASGASTPASSSTSSKGKEKVTSEPQSTETTVTKSHSEPQAPIQQQQQRQQLEDRSWLSERSYGSFTRTFRFPQRIDGDNVRASLRNGVLSISVPRAAVPKVRQIVIR